MIGLILGTSEGRKILKGLNKYTDNLFVFTATKYGGYIYEEYNYNKISTVPLSKEELLNVIKENNINVLIDATHPYALNITKNAIDVCKQLKIEYLRYDRPSCIDKFKNCKNVIVVDDYNDLQNKLRNIKGNILNTTGSRNLDKILNWKLDNRIIHRVLPSLNVIQQCFDMGIKLEDLVAIKGPISEDLNCGFIKQFDAKAMLLKDSGVEGGTLEKIKSCIKCNIYAFVIKRNNIYYEKVFYEENSIVNYIVKNYM